MKWKRIILLKYFFIFFFLFLLYLDSLNIIEIIKKEIPPEKCYLSPDDFDLKIIHLIITRFMVELWRLPSFYTKIYTEDYILNGIRVMKKYLIPSLENQSCRQFIWILMLRDKVDIAYIKSLLNFKGLFESNIIYQKDIKSYIRNITKGFDILITTRIDYDDRIYYDAVNDVRKSINISKPMIIYGYQRGLHFYESNNKYYEFYLTYDNRGAMSVFLSLIIVLNKVNDTYIIYDLETHTRIRNKLLESYK